MVGIGAKQIRYFGVSLRSSAVYSLSSLHIPTVCLSSTEVRRTTSMQEREFMFPHLWDFTNFIQLGVRW